MNTERRHIDLIIGLVLVLFASLSAPWVYGQQMQPETMPNDLHRRYQHTVWTTKEGLPQNSINDIIQTRDGYLWLATFGGLARSCIMVSGFEGMFPHGMLLAGNIAFNSDEMHSADDEVR